jgi:hypothetical protein
LEKPGAAIPEDFYALAKEIECKRPGLAVELGYEMHYSEALGFARKVVKEGVLGDITTARFHGGCPSGAGMDLWQAIPEDLGGIMQLKVAIRLRMSLTSSEFQIVWFQRFVNYLKGLHTRCLAGFPICLTGLLPLGSSE